LIEVHEGTLRQWFKRYPRFKESFDRIQKEHFEGFIEDKLYSLANGHDEVETIEEYHTEKMIDGESVPVKVVNKVKKKAPDIKAIQSLANKYVPNTYKEVDSASNINIKITQSHRSLTTEERLKLLESEGNEVIEVNDYKNLGVLSGKDYEAD